MLRLMLTCHPSMSVAPECGFVLWLEKEFGDWSRADCTGSRRDRFVAAVLRCRKFDTWSLDADWIERSIAARAPRSYAELAAAVHLAYADKQGRSVPWWGDKNNYHVNHVADLDRLFPDCRFVHIVRDGRDVACSYREIADREDRGVYAPRLPYDIESIAAEWSENVRAVDDRLSAMPERRALTIRYEDLVRRPDRELGDVCRLLEVDFDGDMLNFGVENVRLGLEPPELLAWKARTTQPISASNVGRYRHVLSETEITAFERAVGGTLTRFGYDAPFQETRVA